MNTGDAVVVCFQLSANLPRLKSRFSNPVGPAFPPNSWPLHFFPLGLLGTAITLLDKIRQPFRKYASENLGTIHGVKCVRCNSIYRQLYFRWQDHTNVRTIGGMCVRLPVSV